MGRITKEESEEKKLIARKLIIDGKINTEIQTAIIEEFGSGISPNILSDIRKEIKNEMKGNKEERSLVNTQRKNIKIPKAEIVNFKTAETVLDERIVYKDLSLSQKFAGYNKYQLGISTQLNSPQEQDAIISYINMKFLLDEAFSIIKRIEILNGEIEKIERLIEEELVKLRRDKGNPNQNEALKVNIEKMEQRIQSWRLELEQKQQERFKYYLRGQREIVGEGIIVENLPHDAKF